MTTELAPPHNPQAEESVIASLLVDPTAMDMLGEIVTSADFHREPCGWAFSAARELWKRNETINEITVAHELSRAGFLEKAGGISFLSRIVSELATPIGAEHYAGIVHRDATYRSLITAGSQIVRLAYQGGPDLDGTLRRSETLLQSVAGGAEAPGIVSVARAVSEFWEVGEMHQAGVSFSVRSGFPSLDAITGGWQSGNLIIVAARPSVGKSALLLNFARNAAIGQNARIVICTLEMSHREWAVRLLARESGIDSRLLVPAGMSELEERRAMSATGELSGLNIQLADASTQTPNSLRAAVRRGAALMGGVDLVLVDYLQLMGGDGRGHENRNAIVTEISRGLKTLAGDFNVPVVAAAQLSREVERRTPAIPMLSDLRDSGSIEQDADVVTFLYRPRPEKGKRPSGLVKLLVAKNRNGPLATAWLRMRPATSLFEELDVPAEEQDEEYQEAIPGWAR
jgi:replicative DNA helicase